MRRLAVVTTSRADYGLYRPVLAEVRNSTTWACSLLVSGSHLSDAHGWTVRLIEADGHDIAARISVIGEGDDPVCVAEAMGRAVAGFARALERLRPDLLLVLGDRYEMHAAGLAALPLRIPVAHLHGGELTRGAIDDCLRHSLTKLSHLHLVSTETYARRVVQMGEARDRVHVVGAPGLDNLRQTPRLTRDAIAAGYGVVLPPRYVLVAFHPETLAHEHTDPHVRTLLDALEDAGFGSAAVFVASNADTGGLGVTRAWRAAAEAGRGVFLPAEDSSLYLSVMAQAAAMLGNSSSGIIEAASLRLPVVNVGQRQAGRLRPANVVDVPIQRYAIAEALRQVTAPAFRQSLDGLTNPYGDGHAAPRIVRVLTQTDWQALIPKPFHDLLPESAT